MQPEQVYPPIVPGRESSDQVIMCSLSALHVSTQVHFWLLYLKICRPGCDPYADVVLGLLQMLSRIPTDRFPTDRFPGI